MSTLDESMQRNRKRRPFRILSAILIIIGGILLIGSAVGGYYLSDAITSLTTQEQTALKTPLENDPWTSDMLASGRMLIDTIPSGDYQLPINYYYSEKSAMSQNHDTIILVHGLGSNRHELNPYVKYFLELGFNALTYDQRATNDHPQSNNTFGVLERLDLEAAVKYIREQAPDKVLGLWGESFGGITVGLGLALDTIDDEADFAILDSPVGEAKAMIMAEVNKLEIPLTNYFYRWSELMTKLRLGFWLSDADVPKYIGSSETPLLVIYSKADKITPFWMSEKIFEVASRTKDRLAFEDASHAFSFYTYKGEYKAAVGNFLKEVGVLKEAF